MTLRSSWIISSVSHLFFALLLFFSFPSVKDPIGRDMQVVAIDMVVDETTLVSVTGPENTEMPRKEGALGKADSSPRSLPVRAVGTSSRQELPSPVPPDVHRAPVIPPADVPVPSPAPPGIAELAPPVKPPALPREDQASASNNGLNHGRQKDEIAALLGNHSGSEAPVPSRPMEDVGSQRQSEGDPVRSAAMTPEELATLREKLRQCWSPPAGVHSDTELTVRMHMVLNRDGRLAGLPQVVSHGEGMPFRAMAESARRAILACQPYDLPQEKYATWQDIRINFDLQTLLGKRDSQGSGVREDREYGKRGKGRD